MKKEIYKEAFIAGAQWILDEIKNIGGDPPGGFARSLDIKMYPIINKFKEIKKICDQ